MRACIDFTNPCVHVKTILLPVSNPRKRDKKNLILFKILVKCLVPPGIFFDFSEKRLKTSKQNEILTIDMRGMANFTLDQSVNKPLVVSIKTLLKSVYYPFRYFRDYGGGSIFAGLTDRNLNPNLWSYGIHYALIVVVAVIVVIFIYLCLQRTRHGIMLEPTVIIRRSSIQVTQFGTRKNSVADL